MSQLKAQTSKSNSTHESLNVLKNSRIVQILIQLADQITKMQFETEAK